MGKVVLNAERKNEDKEKIQKMETMKAEANLLETKMKAYERFANFYKSDEIR